MDWEKLASNFGLPGVMLAAIAYVMRMWIASNERNELVKSASNERIEMARLKVEDKKADAMATAFGTLSSKIDSHHTDDLQSHSEMAEGIANLHGAFAAFADLTPVRGTQRQDPQGYYGGGSNRPKTNPGGR